MNSKRNRVLVQVLSLWIYFGSVAALSCNPCDRSKCPTLGECPGGLSYDVCGCCSVCARVADQTCGGLWGLAGQCDKGLTCKVSPKDGGSVSSKRTWAFVGLQSTKFRRRYRAKFAEAWTSMQVFRDSQAMLSLAIGKPQHPIQRRSIRKAVSIGGSEILECDINYPDGKKVQHIIQWIKKGIDRPIFIQFDGYPPSIVSAYQGRVRIVEQASLELSGIGTEDEGWYQCSVVLLDGLPDTNPNGTWIYLAVNYSQKDTAECKEKCGVVFAPRCHNDSLLVWSKQLGSCCPKSPKCECKACASQPPVCPTGQVIVRKVNGTGTPGSCCDVYECHDKEIDCDKVVCKEPLTKNVSCPPDSYQRPPLISKNGCCHTHQGCTCKPWEYCKELKCGVGMRVEVIAPATGQAGSCCDRAHCVNDTKQMCISDGQPRRHGEVWSPEKCLQCTCKNRLIFCSATKCNPPAHCSWLSIPEGQCCPVCKGCVSRSSKLYPNGSTWKENNCVTCRCEAGQMYCQAYLCQIRCMHPRKVPGVCCPVCHDVATVTAPPHCPLLNDCSLVCPNGLVTNEKGCFLCKCKPECSLRCVNGYKLDTLGYPLCQCAEPKCPPLTRCQKECVYGFRVGRDGCRKCRCNKCPPFQCKKKCLHGYMENSKNCKICKCKVKHIEPTHTVPLTPATGRRCMSVGGHLMEDGESWHDGCRRCYCHAGKEMCALITCPAPHCNTPIIRIGDCCPSCPGMPASVEPSLPSRCQATSGQHYAEGETWSLDRCTQCICHEGVVLCEVDSCPPVLCHRPIKLPHQCCPICPGSQEVFPVNTDQKQRRVCTSGSDVVYSDGDVWRSHACQSCTCRDGRIHCYSQTCPLLTCNKTILQKGQCCPSCPDRKTVSMCHHDNHMYSPGETWLLDNCTQCTCQWGRTICGHVTCTEYESSCKHLVRVAGQCCPLCYNSSIPPSLDAGHIPHQGEASNITMFGLPHGTLKSYIVTVAVLVIIVACMAIALFVLAIILLRTRRRRQYPEPQIGNATYVDVKKRPKSTNLEFQGISPLGNGEKHSNYTKVPPDGNIYEGTNRYSMPEALMNKVLLDLPPSKEANGDVQKSV